MAAVHHEYVDGLRGEAIRYITILATLDQSCSGITTRYRLRLRSRQESGFRQEGASEARHSFRDQSEIGLTTPPAPPRRYRTRYKYPCPRSRSYRCRPRRLHTHTPARSNHRRSRSGERHVWSRRPLLPRRASYRRDGRRPGV